MINPGIQAAGFAGLTLKAWVLFNGATGAIIKSSGITSVARSSAGVYPVVFASAMASANWFAQSFTEPSNATAEVLIVMINSKTTAGATVQSVTKTLAAADVQTCYVAFYE